MTIRDVAISEAHSDGALRINYDDRGEGEPSLLMMPGWCSSRGAFEEIVEKCARHRRTLVMDWRGHGRSGVPLDDFGLDELVADALAVIDSSDARQIVPVALSHAGWAAIELRRRLRERVPKLVLLDWIVLDPPPPFLGALQALQEPERWEQTREQLFSMWTTGVNNPKVTRFVREDMGTYGFEMWARAGREISAAYARAGNPLRALASLNPPAPVLHLYAQPPDPGYLAAQQSFAATQQWYHVHKLDAASHFPMFEVPDEMAAVIETFVQG